ncbi:Sporulation stage II, protein D firmicutes [Syntrophomonas zehnderi OL-4]|uniref:Sporulation stage II, protein D firmicutes n=1 Tax=Syntrophomonas zehnderi OL-4 TaxID=690567 RepID=A0A0E4G924_9FIRM|nr:stage II sporulation protein D [Syntrophomonas zehnderi]CFX03300.1 Sporulation stage II, protein D firmicutes [Syntrophomonas zehnderi OL-4]
MKKLWRIVLLVFLLALGLWLTMQMINKVPDDKLAEPKIDLYLHQKNHIITMDLEDYIVGTVAAEMPASFAMEALRAQAVCARTYALKRMIEKHPYPLGADLSDDINSCQAFREVQSQNKMGQQNLKKIMEAVNSTRGEILLYNSEPIDALYHSTCGGRTEGIESIAYLRSVKCKYCRDSPYYKKTCTVGNENVNRVVGDLGYKMNIKVVTQTPSGRANELSINGKKVYAARLRKELNLPSQWLELSIGDRQTRITTHGYGHGIGLCQYGANGLAKSGKNYQQILKYYYNDVEIYKIPY